MSRRKQAKPRSLKQDEDWDEAEPVKNIEESSEKEEEMLPLSPSQDQEDENKDEDTKEDDGDDNEKDEANEDYEARTPPEDINGPNDTMDSMESDALGTTPGSSWRSSTPEGGSRSPASSASERDLSFTLGATEHTPYQCQFCDKAFPRLSYLKKHEQTHSDQMPFRCDFCSRLFKHKRSRDRHVKLHTGDRKYRCVHCEAAFSRSDHLKIHMKTHDNQKPFQCTVCNRGYNTAAALTSHMQNHKRGEGNGTSAGSGNHGSTGSRGTPGYRCLQCGDRFRRPDLLQNHVSVAHPSDNVSEESPHASVHTPPSPRNRALPHSLTAKLACMYCTRDSFSSMEQLQAHVRAMHGALLSGELPSSPAQNGVSSIHSPALHFPCDMCTMRFPSGAALIQHTATSHTKCSPGASPLVCVACSVPFDSPAGLAEHYLLAHGEQIRPTDLSKKSNDRGVKRPRSRDDTLGAGTLLCNQCGAALPDFESFRIHVRAHLDGSVGPGPNVGSTRERSPPLSCSQCGARFSSPSALERHAAAHLLALGSEFGCPSCARAFAKPDELQKHLMDLHAHHLYRCAICKEMFDSKVAIQVHFAVKHSHECKVYRCTACTSPSATFRTEAEFALHVRAQHAQHVQLAQQSPASVRCLFCRATCSSELEMQFHLAAHADHFRCPICREGFHVEFLLDRHMQTHHTPQSMNGNSPKPKSTSASRINSKTMPSENNNSKKEGNNCDICDRSDFQSESELHAHRKLVHHIKTGGKNGAVSLSCAYCSENCKSRTELENHMKTHSQSSATGGKHKCLICDEVYPSTAILAEHKLTHCKVLAGNSCTQCKTNLVNEDQFFAHLSQHSNNNNSPSSPSSASPITLPTPCVICRQTLLTDLEARIHARFHLKNSGAVADTFQCALCLKSFELSDVIPTGGELNNGVPTTHVCRNCYRQHSGMVQPTERRCNECHIKFESTAAMEAHMETVHRKTYSCIECQASFESEEEVRLHVQNHVTGGGSLECRLCRRSLGSPLQLQAHLIEHTFAGCGGFTCYLCSAVFTAAPALQQHMLTHGLAARPYDCARCGLKFFFRAELDNHSYTHLEEDARLKLSAAEQSKHPYFMNQNGFHAIDPMAYFTGSPPNMKKIKTSKSPNLFKCIECPAEFGNMLGLHAHMRQHNIAKEGRASDEKAIKQEVPIKQEIEDKCDEYIEVASPPPPPPPPAVDKNQLSSETELHNNSAGDTNGDVPLLSPKKEAIEN